MLTRDIRPAIKQQGFEKGTIYVLESLSEEIKGVRMDINEVGQHYSQLIDVVNQLADALGMMKVAHTKMVGGKAVEDDLGGNTQGIGD